jgi:triosephosphate isomerase
MAISEAKMNRGALMVGNWKMTMGQGASRALAQEIGKGIVERGLNNQSRVRCGIAPSPMCLEGVKTALDGFHSNILVGGQNFFAGLGEKGPTLDGAFTGETSLTQLKEAGAQFSIIGHSERRGLPGYGVKGAAETNAILNEKLRAGLAFVGDKPELSNFFFIFCVGETLQQMEAGHTSVVLTEQTQVGLDRVAQQSMDDGRVVIAYEPVWAIGTGKSASPAQANDSVGLIRLLIERMYGRDIANKLLLQYGGSMKQDNVRSLMEQPDIDGGLIGGAFLKAPDALGILSQTSEIYNG